MGLVAGTSFLAGAALSLRFNAWALIPASLIALVALGIAAIDSSIDLWSFALTAIVAIAAMQMGYLVGAGASTLFDTRTDHEDAPTRSSDVVERPVRWPY
jgi:hypothetical protein